MKAFHRRGLGLHNVKSTWTSEENFAAQPNFTLTLSKQPVFTTDCNVISFILTAYTLLNPCCQKTKMGPDVQLDIESSYRSIKNHLHDKNDLYLAAPVYQPFLNLRVDELEELNFQGPAQCVTFSSSDALPLSPHSPVFDRLAEDASCSKAQLSSVLLRAAWPRSHQCAVEPGAVAL